ncbi:MAG TPA: response regulator [Flavobacteriales bacterium]|nr:response regulator [Flavobacteriales bacterium]
MKLKCIIIDDEPDAIRLLEKVLADFCATKIEIAGTASNSIEGIKLINKTNPDLLFLDVEMPGGTGFDLIEMQATVKPKVVFVTAYDKHAIKAIKYKPDGYLLKPIDINELVNTVDAIYDEWLERDGKNQLSGKYSISVKDETVLVDFTEILYIKAQGRYSDVCLAGNRNLRVCKNIGHFEKELLKKGFVRCHKSYLVNSKHIVKLNKTDGGFIEISNGTSIEISRRKRNALF